MDKTYSFSRVYPSLDISATLKTFPEDFIVKEFISVDFSGDGEHCWVYIEKRNCNTDFIAQRIALYCNVKKMAVSYAGLKDRRALTSQWFSVQLPGLPTPDWGAFEIFFNAHSDEEQIRILESHRHNRKLQRGALKHNKFTITLRDLSDSGDEMFQSLTQRCEVIAHDGVANYFGTQRFGINRNNLDAAERMFSDSRKRIDRHKRSLYLSAARSWIFNCILSRRIEVDLWNKRMPGDVFMLQGKSACFPDDGSEDIDTRLLAKEIHPTSVLWGEGDSMVKSEAAEFELSVIEQFPVFNKGLIKARVKAQRRAIRLMPQQLSYGRQNDDFVLSFDLPAGSYATEVLAEIFTRLTESR